MREFDVLHYIHRVRRAPIEGKQDFIRRHVADKAVLDLRFVAHTLDSCLLYPEEWLHNIIRNNARSVVVADILEEEVKEFQKIGCDAICGDTLSLRLKRRFDVIVCSDLLEHVADSAALLETITYHLNDEGLAILTTPNPFAISRIFNIFFDGWTPVNYKHVSWFCPQTVFQLVERSDLFVDNFCWIKANSPMKTVRRFWKLFANYLSIRMADFNHLLQNDYAIVLRKKPELLKSNDQRPFVSVILPTCNRPEFLYSAFETLLLQDYRHDRFEIIVVDNGTGGADKAIGKVLQKHETSVTVKFIHEQRCGLVYARHSGAKHAQGEILLFGDDDGRFAPNWITSIVDVYRKCPSVGAVGSKIEILWDREPLTWVKNHEGVMGKLDLAENIIVRQGLYINGGSFSILKGVLETAGGFNPGQLGDYILGDSETGLCRKLALLDIPVAWTPKTTMWHLQSVEKNGTFSDIKRRYRNNGICSAYRATFYGWKTWKVCCDVLAQTWVLLGGMVSCLIRLFDESSRRDLALKMAYYWYYLKYLFLYKTSTRIRSEIDAGKWRYDRGYGTPEAVVLRQHRSSSMGGGTV